MFFLVLELWTHGAVTLRKEWAGYIIDSRALVLGHIQLFFEKEHPASPFKLVDVVDKEVVRRGVHHPLINIPVKQDK